MASNLTFCSSLTSTARLHQNPNLSTPICLSKTNLRFLSLTPSSFSSHSFSFSPITYQRSTFSHIPKSSQSEAPVVEAEVDSTDFQPAEIVETAQIAETATREAKHAEIFAVVMVGGRQYIVFPGRFLYTQRLKGANVNDKIILNKVLLVGTKTSAYIGKPIVPNAAVHAVVEEQGLNPKVVVFKYKKKKNYRRNIGHRQPNTRIRITGITGFENSPVVTLDS